MPEASSVDKPLSHDQADALLLEVGTESPTFTNSLKEMVKQFGQGFLDKYGGFMSDQSAKNISTAWQRTIPINVEEKTDAVMRWIGLNDKSFRGGLLARILEFADTVGIKTNKIGRETLGTHTQIGQVSFIEVGEVADFLETNDEVIQLMLKTHTPADVGEFISFYLLVVQSIHEAIHQGQSKKLPAFFIELLTDYYVAEYLKLDTMYKKEVDLANQLIEKFGDDIHRLVFDNLNNWKRKRTIINFAKSLCQQC